LFPGIIDVSCGARSSVTSEQAKVAFALTKGVNEDSVEWADFSGKQSISSPNSGDINSGNASSEGLLDELDEHNGCDLGTDGGVEE
jgi:hypothetical protein